MRHSMRNMNSDPGLNDLDAMINDYEKSPEIYHASKFWDKLNKLNIKWLHEDGLENFKRTVNNNYFNWLVNIRATHLLNLLGTFFSKNWLRPHRFLQLAYGSIPEMYCRTYLTDKTRTGIINRKLYTIYLKLLYDFVLSSDNLNLFKELEEPTIGNPITIQIDRRRISQDICNSYLEYLFIRNTLDKKFQDIGTVLEIGSGYGRLGYIFKKLHDKRIKYIVVDIPPALFIAQWYFERIFPEVTKFRYRNFRNFSEIKAEFQNSSVCFLLPHQLDLLPDQSVDLMINVSSLQEMSMAQIKNYYEIIHRKSSYFYTKQWTFWENPEDKISVPAVAYPTNPEWELLRARLNPIHKSFFEAIFLLHPNLHEGDQKI